MTVYKISRRRLRELVEDGYGNHEIEDRLGVPHGYLNSRIQRLKTRIAAEARQKRQAESLVIYFLPLEEVYRRYGRPGEQRERAPLIADIDGLAERKEQRTDDQ